MEKVPCHLCNKLISPRGMHTHFERTHGTEEQRSKYSSGYNGRYKDKDYIDKITAKAKLQWSDSPKKLANINCKKCNASFHPARHDVLFCSKSCASMRPRTTEEKKKICDALSKERIEITCPSCSNIFKSLRLTAKYCSKKCRGIAHRKSDGHKLLLTTYRNITKFDFALNKYPDEFDFDLIRQHGWYSARNRGNNLNGVSRDHIVPVTFGWTNDIDPDIIKHPANCQLLLHNDNVSKGNKVDLTIEQLLEKIKIWDIKYHD